MATLAAGALSVFLLFILSMFGLRVQEVYTGKIEASIEGALMITSAIFITWAVFFLHKHFGRYKTKLLQKIKNSVEQEEQKGLFLLVFAAVFREGFEIVLFLSTIYFSSNPQSILIGFVGGVVSGLLVSLALFTATLKIPVYHTFRITSGLLILFAAGLLSRGVNEFTQAGFIPKLNQLTLIFVPSQFSLVGSFIKSIFGITQHMDVLQLFLYILYVAGMGWWVFLRRDRLPQRSMR